MRKASTRHNWGVSASFLVADAGVYAIAKWHVNVRSTGGFFGPFPPTTGENPIAESSSIQHRGAMLSLLAVIAKQARGLSSRAHDS